MLLATAIGCGPGGPAVAPVSGVITLDGKPLAGARINTQPIAKGNATDIGVGSFAVTDDAGRYALELVDPARPGAIVGSHVVRIRHSVAQYRAGREDAPTYQGADLPRSASDGSLTLDVPKQGRADANFDLQSD
jgi:hypothetical protein